MRTLITSIAFVAALVKCGGSALAADQPLTGKKLLIKNNADPTKNKTVILIKDGSGVSPASQPTTGTICIVGGLPGPADDTFLDISDDTDPGEWATIGGGFKYKKGAGAPGDPCKVVLIKCGKLLKAVCKGSDADYDVNNGGPVNVALKTN